MTEEIKKELAQLRAARGVLKGKLTRFENYLQDPTNQNKFSQLGVRLNSIEEDRRNFEQYQSRLEILDKDEENEREKIESTYFEVIGVAYDILKPQTNVQQSNTQTQVQFQSTAPISNALGKLPDLGLPEFQGKYETWLSFWDIYNSIVHNRTDLSDTQKFLYLKICCKGDALKTIDSLEITENNYSIAIDTLKKRYENKRAIINQHINTILFKLPDITRESAQNLRNLLDIITQNLNALDKLKLPITQWDALLIPIILQKLDDRTKREWEGKLDNNKMPTLNELTEFLSKKCCTLETLYNESRPQNNQPRNQHVFYKNPSYNKNSKGSTSFSKSNISLNQQCYTGFERIICSMCQGTHFIYQCSQFLNLPLNEKYNHVIKHKLCTNCLRSGHLKYQCLSKNCRKCNLKHNTILHDNNNNETLNNTASGNGNVSANSVGTQKLLTPASSTKSGITHVVTEFGAKNNSSDLPTLATEGQNLQENLGQNRTPDINGLFPINGNIVGNCYEVSHASVNQSQVLLSTANILIEDSSGKYHTCTALLDSGSQSNFISQFLCKKLNLKCEGFYMPLAGINQITTNIKFKTKTKIKSRINAFEANLTFLVLPVITEKLPLVGFSKELVNIPQNIQLADEHYNEPKQIDILIGANLFYELLGFGKIRLGKNSPVLQETKLGWILTGSIFLGSSMKQISQKTFCNFIQQNETDTLNETLVRFWEVEELPQKQLVSKEAQYCEAHFKKHTVRNSDGKFVVKLPFLPTLEQKLGMSKELCLKRFLCMEARLKRDKNLNTQYKEFMTDYEKLDHMTIKCPLSEDSSDEDQSYFIPHHPVLRESSLTTRCRVVFDASFKTNNNISLNDMLCLGPTVQDDLLSIVLRFRLRPVVLNADIKMMYRQILVDPSDRPYQQILWRYNENHSINVYFLNTLTYGTKTAPYLAQRCLKQLSIENQKMFPRTSKIIQNSFYMDDLIVSVNSTEEAIEIYREINMILSQAGFDLRKWSSNENLVLDFIAKTSTLKDEKLILPRDNKEIKTLGIAWNPNLDTFKYTIVFKNNSSQVTKRSILSVLAQIYDPLGLIGPALIKAKCLMQKLWQLRLSWDEPIPDNLKQYWLNFLSQIPILNDIQIRRQVLQTDYKSIEIFGFCDASIKAYGAAIYLCSTNNEGKRFVRLLCAKSKVAPLKKLTLPRLELLAAFLLGKLVQYVKEILDINISEVTLFSDSTIVLSWLKIDPSLLKTFVGNRVAKITELTDINCWKHVGSQNNAADIISRGIDPEDLINADIWWYGPSFLLNSSNLLQEIDILKPIDLPEIKISSISLAGCEYLNFNIFEKYSTLLRLQRITAYILRFKNLTLNKIKPLSEHLSVEELKEALNILIRLAQSEMFSSEIRCLKTKKPIDKHSKLLSLNPFIDNQNILRVGGRISHSQNISYNQKHQVILPYKHKLTYLIVSSEHIKQLHAGTQNLLSILRLNYWPVNGKNMVKTIIRSCVRCFRVNPQRSKFLMGQLPASRVTPSRVFSKCAVDFAGPIYVKDGVRRKCQTVKTYICVFVCLAVRAVHIELVNDLTTDSFLNALKRFISRRGKPSDIYSDNGLNFVGANNHFLELYNLLSNKEHNKTVSEFLSKDQINWHFIPAKSPHMGGLWEATIKATKYHLRRILGNAMLHYEEMYTLLTQIESCLNSRPLTPLSNDPDDFLPLTPAHFLIGDSLACTPQIDVLDTKVNRLTRYHYLQQLLQQFWCRWSQEYLSQLQARTKWQTEINLPIQVGSLVIMIEDSKPPLQWHMARVVELHPGLDNVIRVISVRISNGSIFKRSLSKICLLPIETS